MISETLPKQISWLGMENQNLTQRSTHSAIKRNVQQHKIRKELKPGLVTSYDIQPGNGEGLFWFWRFINLSLTHLLNYLDTYPLTYSPGTHTERVT